MFMFFKGPIAGPTLFAHSAVAVSVENGDQHSVRSLPRRGFAAREPLDQGQRDRRRADWFPMSMFMRIQQQHPGGGARQRSHSRPCEQSRTQGAG